MGVPDTVLAHEMSQMKEARLSGHQSQVDEPTYSGFAAHSPQRHSSLVKDLRNDMRLSPARSRPVVLVACLIACSTSVAALLKPREVDKIPAAPPDQTIAYGSDAQQFAHLRLPKGNAPFPVAVIIHGGCWLKFADANNTEPMSDALRNAGVATWNIEYRRADNEGGGWPGTFSDIAAAIDHLREIAPRYQLDLNRVVAVGHSAGGHLALWAAARSRLESNSALFTKQPLQLKGAVNLAGPSDLRTFPSAHMQQVCGSVPTLKLLGGSVEDFAARYRDGSPAALLPIGVPQILITGSLDHLVPPAFGQSYEATARRSGDDVEMIVIEGAGHFEVIAPTTPAWPIVQERVLSLVK